MTFFIPTIKSKYYEPLLWFMIIITLQLNLWLISNKNQVVSFNKNFILVSILSS